MLVTCLVAWAALAPAPTVTDFFPTTPGVRRHYDIEYDSRSGTQIEEVGKPVVIEGKPTTPVTQTLSGISIGTCYYSIEDGTVLIVATSPKALLKKAIPILKVGVPSAKWDFEQASPVLPPQNLTVHLESVLKGKRKVLGTERQILEVKYAVETPKGVPVVYKSNQTVTYASGLGMIEWIEESTVGKNHMKKKMTLTKVEQPAAG